MELTHERGKLHLDLTKRNPRPGLRLTGCLGLTGICVSYGTFDAGFASIPEANLVIFYLGFASISFSWRSTLKHNARQEMGFCLREHWFDLIGWEPTEDDSKRGGGEVDKTTS